VDLFGSTVRMLEGSLDYSAVKNQTISNNIANIDTPGYKSKDVVFRNVLNDELNSASKMKRTHPKHMPFDNGSASRSFQTITKMNSNYNHNGNNVDIDKEMAELAKNQIYYQGLVDRLNGKFHTIQTVIRGGK